MKINDFALERFFAEYEFKVSHLLCCSDCESLSIEELLDAENGAAREEFLGLRLGYSDSLGSPELRQEVSGLYQTHSLDSILVCAGAQEGIFLFMNALLAAEDHVIVQFPAYQSLYDLPRALGCRVTLWPGDPLKNWRPDLQFLRDSITESTRALVINSPHNPSGFHFSAAEFEEIVELARRHDLHLFSDEVYRFLEYEPRDLLPPAADLYEKAVSLGVMSKSFGLPGLRIGWLVSRDEKLKRNMAALKDYTSICAGAPSEWLAACALRQRAFILERNRKLVRANLEILQEFMAEHEGFFSWSRPLAGCLALPRLKEFLEPGDFYRSLRQEQGLLLAPGDLFTVDPAFFRIGFGRRDFPAGLEILRRFLAGQRT